MSIRRIPTEQEIADRARELYEQHGEVGGDGEANRDWAEAKAELEAAEVAAESRDITADSAEQPAAASGPPGSRTGSH